MATHSSILKLGESPWTEEPGRLQSSSWDCKELDMTERLNTAQNRNRLTDSQNKLKLGHGKDGGKGESGSLGWTCTHCYIENGWITNKDLLCSTWNSAQYYVAAQMGGKSGGEWIRVYVWLSPFALHLKLSQLC